MLALVALGLGRPVSGRSEWLTLGPFKEKKSTMKKHYEEKGFVEIHSGTENAAKHIQDECHGVEAVVRSYDYLSAVMSGDQAQSELCRSSAGGGGKDCGSPVLIIEPSESSEDLPTVFISGAIHGNERLGPNVVVYLAEFLSESCLDPYLLHIMTSRRIILAPFPNAYGYVNNTRTDHNGTDPNRDFPFDNKEYQCMNTPTTRVVMDIFRDYEIDLTITFHGGMRALTYGWGSEKYMMGTDVRSYRPPDVIAMTTIGSRMQSAAGLKSPQLPANPVDTLPFDQRDYFYPLGQINDAVYPVTGGMEDWTYAAGWECSSAVKESECHVQPRCNGEWTSSTAKSITYLVETDDDKSPPSSTYGEGFELSDPATAGHIYRNAAMGMVGIESIGPPVLWQFKGDQPEKYPPKHEFTLVATGCSVVSGLQLAVIPTADDLSAQSCEEKAMEFEQAFLSNQMTSPDITMIDLFDEDSLRNQNMIQFSSINLDDDGNIVCARFDEILLNSLAMPLMQLSYNSAMLSSACLVPILIADQSFIGHNKDDDVLPPIPPQSTLAMRIRRRHPTLGTGPNNMPLFAEYTRDPVWKIPELDVFVLVGSVLVVLSLVVSRCQYRFAFLRYLVSRQEIELNH